MFIEHDINGHIKQGSIEAITGSMFSGKTEELIRRLKRAKFARQSVEIFKPAIDMRYSKNDVVSHDENTIRSSPVENSSNILLLSGNVNVIGIDEAQFFDKGLVNVVEKLANMGIRVIVAGLDMDFKGAPFGPMPGILAIADHVTKVHAICVRCGNIAQFSHRTSEKEQLVVLGEKNEYEPLCRRCYLSAIHSTSRNSERQ
jgi:thymidine kinase